MLDPCDSGIPECRKSCLFQSVPPPLWLIKLFRYCRQVRRDAGLLSFLIEAFSGQAGRKQQGQEHYGYTLQYCNSIYSLFKKLYCKAWRAWSQLFVNKYMIYLFILYLIHKSGCDPAMIVPGFSSR